MDNPNDNEDTNSNFVAERWRWHTIPRWMIPSLLVPIVLAVVFVGYVVLQAVH